MTAPIPSPIDDFTAQPGTELSLDVWNGVLPILVARIRAAEEVAQDAQDFIAQGTAQALLMIQTNVAPQIVAMQNEIAAALVQVGIAEDRIAALINGDIPAAAVAESATRVFLSPEQRDALVELLEDFATLAAQVEALDIVSLGGEKAWGAPQIITGSSTVAADRAHYVLNCSSAEVILLMPPTPADGFRFRTEQQGTQLGKIRPQGGKTIFTLAEDFEVDIDALFLEWVWSSALNTWRCF